MIVHPVWLLPVAALLAVALTGALRRYARPLGMIDIPNARSSHSRPTARGGGVAIVVAFLGGIAAMFALGAIDRPFAIGLAGAGLIVAVVGFLDDRRSRPVAARLAAHMAAAAWALWWLDGMPPIGVGDLRLDLGWWGHGIALFGLVWLLNLYNFMDGIDGLAGLETVLVALGGAVIIALRGGAGAEWLVPSLLAASALGFLWWNWPPARIFMGDAGSGFIGLTFGALAIRGAHVDPALLWAWLILLGVFVVDATVTLLRRLSGADRVYQAHRDHAYQHAATLSSHRAVTLAVGAINTVWLLPLAVAVALGWLGGVTGLAIAYAPLVWLVFRFKAGVSGII